MPNRENPPPPIPDHQLLRRIGRGSYGEVWLAQSATGAYRAVKIVRRPDAEDEDGSYDREFNGVRTVEPISRNTTPWWTSCTWAASTMDVAFTMSWNWPMTWKPARPSTRTTTNLGRSAANCACAGGSRWPNAWT